MVELDPEIKRLAEEVSKEKEKMLQDRARLAGLNPRQNNILNGVFNSTDIILRKALLLKGLSEEDCGRVLLGIYHHPEIQEPLELKYKLANDMGFSRS